MGNEWFSINKYGEIVAKNKIKKNKAASIVYIKKYSGKQREAIKIL